MSATPPSLFPIPLVGVATLLAVLVLLTPILVNSGGPAAGSIFTQAEVVVDPGTGSGPVHFYVHGIGNVRYSVIQIGFGENYSWGGPLPHVWDNWTNGTGIVELSASDPGNPIAVNVSARYVDSSGGSTWYFARIGCSVSGGTMYFHSFTVGVDVPSSLSLSGYEFPYAILLANIGPGGPP